MSMAMLLEALPTPRHERHLGMAGNRVVPMAPVSSMVVSMPPADRNSAPRRKTVKSKHERSTRSTARSTLPVKKAARRSTKHSRRRRLECTIPDDLVQEAQRLGMKEIERSGRHRYTYRGYTVIWDSQTKKTVTCWKVDEQQNETAATLNGTKKVRPQIIQKNDDHDTLKAKQAHDSVRQQIIQHEQNKWSSHAVFVVDLSGSMRKDDIDGARCRSDAVFTAIAKYVKYQIESFNNNPESADNNHILYDLVSVIIYREEATCVLELHPTDWVLYNEICDYKEWTTERPEGHGYFQPALEKARELLSRDTSGTCALSLFFCSDGRPSDRNPQNIPALAGQIARQFGGRLSVLCLGMAATSNSNHGTSPDFEVLRQMIAQAKSYGSKAALTTSARLSASTLAQIVRDEISSSISDIKSEYTASAVVSGYPKRFVRTDIDREPVASLGNEPSVGPIQNPQEWSFYKDKQSYCFVEKISKWSATHQDLVEIIDPRCAVCKHTVFDGTLSNDSIAHNTAIGKLCQGCHTAYFCYSCLQRRQGAIQSIHSKSKCSESAAARDQGHIIADSDIPSFYLAIKRACFGEGSERVAYKCRFLSVHGNDCGRNMVCKESRFEEVSAPSMINYQHEYQKQYARAQFEAKKLAVMFNEKLQKANGNQLFSLIQFSEPLVVDLVVGGKAKTVIVEPMIKGGDFQKFNTNGTKNSTRMFNMTPVTSLNQSLVNLLLFPSADSTAVPNIVATGVRRLETVREDDSESDNDGDMDAKMNVTNSPSPRTCRRLKFETPRQPDHKDNSTNIQFIDSFSHFSYVHSAGQMLCCDLQGVLQQEGPTQNFMLTDAAIHHSDTNQAHQYGRTNLGMKGIHEFFKRHKCNEVCQLLGIDRSPGSPFNPS